MGNSSVDRVHTTSRLAQWRIDSLGSPCGYRKSPPFDIGLWNWYISVERTRALNVRLFPAPSAFTEHKPPIASFVIRAVSLAGGRRRTLTHPEVTDKQLKSSNDFVWAIDVWAIDVLLTGKFIIDVEFLDLKVTSQRGDEPYSIWVGELARKPSNETSLSMLARMLKEGIHTDITINASDGSIGAHRAVLASRSPVFLRMFSHDLKEKELSAIDIPNMSIKTCEAFLNYIYGNISHEDFLIHRLSLLRAADKYDLSELKEACHKSLLEDINSMNVLGRLQYASLFRLEKLKSGCKLYLVKFGKIFDIREEFNSFVQTADRELVAEIFDEVLSAWRGI